MILLFYTVIQLCLLCVPTDAAADGDIRLVNGSHSREGRVEIYYNGVWGTVCDDSWGVPDAIVVCRQLQYYEGVALPFDSALFGQGVGPISLDDVNCGGSETRLLSCPRSKSVGEHDCSHGEDAGVSCAMEVTISLHVSCGRMLYIPEKGAVSCWCSSSRQRSFYGRLLWKVDGRLIANGTFGVKELQFPTGVVTRHDDGKMATCETDWTLQEIYFTNRVAYGPDNVNITFQNLYDVNGKRQVIATCLVMNPKDDSMVEWSGPCNGQSGFTCTLSSPVSGQSVTCRVTNRDNNNHSLEATAYLPLPDYGPIGVNLTYKELCTDRGPSYVILTCHVTGIGPLEPAFVEWSPPCHGQEGFTCTLTSPSDGQNVSCTLNKTTTFSDYLVLSSSSVILRLNRFQCIELSLLRWVIVGAGSGVGLLLIVLVIIIIVLIVSQRRRQKNRPEADKQSNFYSSVTMSKCAAAVDGSPSDPPEDDYEIIQ